jgi:hypothetical protein
MSQARAYAEQMHVREAGLDKDHSGLAQRSNANPRGVEPDSQTYSEVNLEENAWSGQTSVQLRLQKSWHGHYISIEDLYPIGLDPDFFE